MDTSPTMDEIRKMSAITANYNGLRGLILIPPALWLLAYGTSVLFAPGARDWVLTSLIIAFGAMAAITVYYSRRFGRVRALHETAGQWGAAILGLVVFIGVGSLADHVLESPIWPQGVQIALAITIMTQLPPLLRRRPADLALSRYWQVMCALVAVVALLPLGLLTGGRHPLNASDEIGHGTMLLVFGACFLIGGLLDHRLLARTLTRST